MKQPLLLLVILALRLNAVAQDSLEVQQSTLKDLEIRINQMSSQDTSKIGLLAQYAEASFYNLNFVDGLKKVQDIRTLSETLRYPKGQALYDHCMAIFHREGNLALYYLVLSNRALRRPTYFGPFYSVRIAPGIKDDETDLVISNLATALHYFEKTEEIELRAHIHMALAEAYMNQNNIAATAEHRKIASNLYSQLNMSYPVLAIMANEIQDLWYDEKEEAATKLSLEASDIFVKEKNQFIKALDAVLLGNLFTQQMRLGLGLEYLYNAEALLQDLGDKDLLRCVYWLISFVFDTPLKDGKKGLEYEFKILELFEETNYDEGIEYTYLRIVQNSDLLTDGADFYWERIENSEKGVFAWFDQGVQRQKAKQLFALNKIQEAITILEQSIYYFGIKDPRGAAESAMYISDYFQKVGDLISTAKYAEIAYDYAKKGRYLPVLVSASGILSECHEKLGENSKSYAYLKLFKEYKEKSDNLENAARLSEVLLQAALKNSQKEIEQLEIARLLQTEENKTQRLWIILIVGALFSSIILVVVIYRNAREKEKTNSTLSKTLINLKSTQSQLIQSEKMASLGELTAGIAHEIQNPLNFVNNFSEVNKELGEELQQAIEKGDTEEIKAIAKDLIENEEKINHHGKRAEAIVRSMLQHSRTSEGKKELTDLNALCDEYLRLAYHGLRAKDNRFNAEYKLNLDPDLPKIEVVPQDIGRVLLNLINNAFQAASEVENPSVTVATRKMDKGIEITVADNGPGIPDNIKDKIFQPFFTTKPTGQGTGLGLSLSYDIVKAHGGELKVETKDGEGSEFIIQLPLV